MTVQRQRLYFMLAAVTAAAGLVSAPAMAQGSYPSKTVLMMKVSRTLDGRRQPASQPHAPLRTAIMTAAEAASSTVSGLPKKKSA